MSARQMLAVLVQVAFGMACGLTSATAQETPVPFALSDASNTGLQAQIAPVQPALQPQVAPPQPAPQPPVAPAQPAPPAQPAFARAPLPARSGPRLASLSAVLVTGDTDDAPSGRGGGPQLEVPAAAKKALASISSFLPYKSYSMADAALVSANLNQLSVVIMRDPELMNTLLRLQLGPSPAADTFNVAVSLSELSTSRPDDKTGRQLITTNVNVAPGETVVVGTSRLGGGRKAYVLLLTAIAK